MVTTEHRKGGTQHEEPGVSASPVLKFLIGLTAGVCSSVVPPLLPKLASPNPDLTVFTVSYVIGCAIFSALIGAATAIMEWHVPRSPSQTFMAALGIPALILGTLNTNRFSDELRVQRKAFEQFQTEVGKETGIPTLPASRPGPSAVLPRSVPAIADIVRVRAARARVSDEYEAARSEDGVVVAQFPIEVREPLYAIVLERAASAAEAQQRAAQLRQKVPDAKVAHAGSEFFVIKGDRGSPKAEALLEAMRLKNTQQLSPSLIEWDQVRLLE